MYIYTRTYYIAIYIREIQLTMGQKEKRKRYIYIEKTQPTPKQNVIYLHIRKIQLTSGQKEKEKRYIQKYNIPIYIEKIQTNY